MHSGMFYSKMENCVQNAKEEDAKLFLISFMKVSHHSYPHKFSSCVEFRSNMLVLSDTEKSIAKHAFIMI